MISNRLKRRRRNMKRKKKQVHQNAGKSNTNPTKKCLLIGINYRKSPSELRGCINDTLNIKKFLIGQKFCTNKDIILMNDNCQGNLYPTRKNILQQLNALVQLAKSEHSKGKKTHFFFHYSGHGTYLRDKNGDESDGRDEALVPIDAENSGLIVDDQLKRQIIDKLPSSCKMTVLVDACHSGSSMDLKYTYKINSIAKKTDKKANCNIDKRQGETRCAIVKVSGCTDSQTSADAYISGQFQGAMTGSFLKAYRKGITYNALILQIRKYLRKGGFSQIPQLTSGKHISIARQFEL